MNRARSPIHVHLRRTVPASTAPASPTPATTPSASAGGSLWSWCVLLGIRTGRGDEDVCAGVRGEEGV